MRKSYKELEALRAYWLKTNSPYRMAYWEDWDYSALSNVMYKKKTGNGRTGTFNDCIIMADTETSKRKGAQYRVPDENHVVAWTISIRAHHMNVVTLWGRKPSDMMECINTIMVNLAGQETYIYFHNLNYDWCFLRLFFFQKFGIPDNQLNTKPHYPLFIKWKSVGLVLRDSYMLSQRSLERWAKDMDVEHQKAIGSWDYDKYRTQDEDFSDEELHYIENDTLAGVECIDKMLQALGKTIYSIPYTATGIVRAELREIAKKNRGHDNFLRQALDLQQYHHMIDVYAGGLTHTNRFIVDLLMDVYITQCKDFASSYPFTMLSERFPSGAFKPYKDCKPELILSESKHFCFFFKLCMLNFKLKDPLEPMPYLQYYKLKYDINIGPAEMDNGRVLKGGYCEIWLNEVDLQIIMQQYEFEDIRCCEVQMAPKDYLPRWMTDYIYKLFEDKCKLKGGDPVLYSMAKSRLNSVYGLTVQRSIQEEIEESRVFAEEMYIKNRKTGEEEQKAYDKYLKSKNTILNYQIGVWVTSYARRNLILGLGSCIDDKRKEDGRRAEISHWLYSDTDSIYSDRWNENRVRMYNELCKKKLLDNGYGPVIIGDKEYWLGIAEDDKECIEFKSLGAKRYAYRLPDESLHITVAGVPKKGVICLEDDINNFTKDMIFDGERTGKKAHYYIYSPNGIHIDEDGNEIGDSIDLQPCDYRLDQTEQWSFLEEHEICIPSHETDELGGEFL